MLTELRIRDLAIIDRLDLTFAPGFNVLTGETGVGKSIIIDAVNLLLGDRALADVVRSGASAPRWRVLFQLCPFSGQSGWRRLVAEHGLEGESDLLVLAREVRANGRSVAVNGGARRPRCWSRLVGCWSMYMVRASTCRCLREREHVGLLDRYAGLNSEVAQVAGLARRVRGVRRALEGLRQNERERARRIDLLAYQVDEIRVASLTPDEAEALEAERRRLANAEQLAELSNEALVMLSGGDMLGEEAGQGPLGALDALGTAEQALSRLARLDPGAASLVEQMGEVTALLDDLARELARYRDGVEFNPHRLAEVEERVHLIHGLQRKYGDTLADILTYGERAAAELEAISHAEERIAGLEAEEAELLAELGRLGAALSAARRAAGERMARAIEAELADLQMAKARFAASISWTQDPSGAVVGADAAAVAGQTAGRFSFDSYGLDTVAFLVSANPGEPLKPLAKVASGGETSRLMLALKTVLGRADETPTLIFDEIDQGIGGRVGGTVGRKLWGLTRGQESGVRSQESGTSFQLPASSHQVLCITHLPQLAAYGDSHYHVAKHTTGERTMTEVRALAGEERVTELAQMMGVDSAAGRTSVTEMMAEVLDAKKRT